MSGSMTTKGQKRVPFTPQTDLSQYAQEHCPSCRYGWMRSDKDGKLLAICLLERLPVIPNLEFCDRWEQDTERAALYLPAEETPAEAPAAAAAPAAEAAAVEPAAAPKA